MTARSRETSHMTNGVFVALFVGFLALLLGQPPDSALILVAQSAPMPTGAVAQPVSPDNLRVVLLGTAAGPRVDLEQFGAIHSSKREASGFSSIVAAAPPFAWPRLAYRSARSVDCS